jgi:hypothetical protein
MRGRITRQSNLFVKINLEDLIPADHPLRPIKRMADEALAAMSRTFAAAYAPAEKGGRPALRASSVRAHHLRHAVRWFLDMTPDERCFDHSDFTNFRARLDALDITRKFSDRIVRMALEAGLISEEHFSIDGSLIQSHASLKSLKHIEKIRAEKEAAAQDNSHDDDDDDTPRPLRPDSNAWVDFKGQKRSNKTHRSTTDPEARLYTKSSGQAALLSHSMHVLMENRYGLGVDIRVGKADGYAERACALKMLDRVKRHLGLEPATLGADKGYDSEDFLLALEARGIEPHVACKSRKEIQVRREDDHGGWARWHNQQCQRDAAFGISQRKRKLDEEVFGWCKTVGGLRRMRVAGRWKIQQLAHIALATLNLIRMSKLLAT